MGLCFIGWQSSKNFVNLFKLVIVSTLHIGITTSTITLAWSSSVFVNVGRIARKIYFAKRETAAAISIQNYIRMCLTRRAYLKLHSSAIIIQSHVRGFTTRQRFLHGKEHKAATIIQVILPRDELKYAKYY